MKNFKFFFILLVITGTMVYCKKDKPKFPDYKRCKVADQMKCSPYGGKLQIVTKKGEINYTRIARKISFPYLSSVPTRQQDVCLESKYGEEGYVLMISYEAAEIEIFCCNLGVKVVELPNSERIDIDYKTEVFDSILTHNREHSLGRFYSELPRLFEYSILSDKKERGMLKLKPRNYYLIIYGN